MPASLVVLLAVEVDRASDGGREPPGFPVVLNPALRMAFASSRGVAGFSAAFAAAAAALAAALVAASATRWAGGALTGARPEAAAAAAASTSNTFAAFAVKLRRCVCTCEGVIAWPLLVMKLRAAGTFGGGPPAGGFVAVGSKACGPVFNFAAAAAAARALREGNAQ